MLSLFFLLAGLGGKIQGTVYDTDTREPIPYVDIIIVGTELGTTTDNNGRFYFLNVPVGKYTLEFSHIAYQKTRIKDVLVQIGQTARLKVKMKSGIIEVEPLDVVAERPLVKKDMVGTTYIIRKKELSFLPVDQPSEMVKFQPAVVNFDSAIHVRGGRATEVDYMIDGVSIIDPQSGEPVINVSKNIMDEVIFLPGNFDAEYGRAMSGIINIITKYPGSHLGGEFQTRGEISSPYCYNFGYQNFHSLIHLPVHRRMKGLFSFYLMHTDDWDPRLILRPHEQRDDYTFYGKLHYTPSGKLNIKMSYAVSRTQFDRYRPEYKFHLDHYRSDLRKGNLQVFDLNYLPDTKKFLNLNISRLWTNKKLGVRESGEYGIFDDFTFKRYQLLEYPRGTNKNPFGVDMFKLRTEGDYPEYQDQTSLVIKTNAKMDIQLNKNNELKSGLEWTYLNLKRFAYLLSSDTTQPIVDDCTITRLNILFLSRTILILVVYLLKLDVDMIIFQVTFLDFLAPVQYHPASVVLL